MKLELKHLAAYLPYGVRFNGKLKGWVSFTDTNNMILCPIDLVERWQVIKPILRPLSDLTKDKKFNDLYFYFYDKDEGLIVERKNENYTRLNELSYLFENHYDVFGLIDNGLAIDINTIK